MNGPDPDKELVRSRLARRSLTKDQLEFQIALASFTLEHVQREWNKTPLDNMAYTGIAAQLIDIQIIEDRLRREKFRRARNTNRRR